ncbi:MAG: ester cyclase [Pseudomonadota bacterium]
MTKPITHVATTDISEMLNAGTERRMDLPGFHDEFVDFPHFIIRITDEIWRQRNIEKCKDWYAEDCAIHTLAGDIIGAEIVTQNTYDTLKAFPDRTLDGDNVIWSDEGDGAFYSSHLITSKMTNEGASEFGPATGRSVLFQTIAECLCKDNKVIEEWLARDNLALCTQLGFDPDAVARQQANKDIENGINLIDLHKKNRTAIEKGGPLVATTGSASKVAVEALKATLSGADLAELNGAYDFRADVKAPGGDLLYGTDQIGEWFGAHAGALSDITVSVDHIAEIPYLGHARDVSLRWGISANHSGDGKYGPATGAPLYILGVTQFRVMNNRVREATFIWDDIALRRQVETARQLS